MAAKKTAPVVPVVVRKPLSKSWNTSDDALTLILSAEPNGDFDVSVEDEADGGSVQLAIDFDQIDELIKLLQEIRSTAARYRKGEDIPSDPVDDEEEEDEEDLEDEEDEGEEGDD
jgi:hypothetical protein